MIGRLFSLALGLALVALGVLINRPDLYGATAPHLVLGPYEAWRQVVGLVAGGMGVVIFIAAIVRQGAPKKRKRDGIVMTFDDPAPAQSSTPPSTSESFTIDGSTAHGSNVRSGAAVASPLW